MGSRITLAIGLFVLLAAPAAAQAPGIEIAINPRVGLYMPLTSLGEVQSATETVTAELEGSLAVGLGLEIDLPVLPLIRLNVDYATGSTVSQEGVDMEAGETKLLAVVGDLVLRPAPRILFLQPYFVIGGGLKQYDFDAGNPAGLQDSGDPTVHAGAGLDLSLGPLNLNAEVGDYVSWYEISEGGDTSEMQHDVFVTVGLKLGAL